MHKQAMASEASRGTQRLLYRGVHFGHPAIELARKGMVVPGNIDGIVTPEQHNVDDVSARSPFTSWTPHIAIARNYARRHGPGGVLLTLESGSPAPDELWSWHWSPDEYGEGEILLHGRRSGATVEMV